MTARSGCPQRVRVGRAVLVAGALLMSLPALADPPFARTEKRTHCTSYDALRRPYFGDLHVHTTLSMDANMQDTRNTPRDAYRFARGEEVGLQPYDASGKPQRTAKLRRPLDFTAVTDHSEYLGEVRVCRSSDLPGSDSDVCWLWRTFPALVMGPIIARNMLAKDRFQLCGVNDQSCLEQAEVVWGEIQAAAEEAYDRSPACRFTSFVGYEWTATGGQAQNLHRNVIFRNERVPALPVSWVETPAATDLWARLQKECVDGLTGCDVLTIPHNSNLSGPGLMFESARLTKVAEAGRPVDLEEARLRQRWEPLIEIAQHKGDSECLLGGDTTDEACGFEKLPYNSFAGVGRFRGLNAPGDLTPSRAAMVREALKKGLALEQQLGVNPLKYGIIGSTDTHLGTPGMTDEDTPKGHGGAGIQAGAGLPDNLEFNPGGLAVVWAEENSRDALFSAMQRRETYGTSGTRPVVRFFGGWGYEPALCGDADFVTKGYAGGVPMGSDLPAKPGSAKAPRFALWALMDPGTGDAPGTALQRVQVVKGWADPRGGVHERVFDVAGGPNGASVDLATCAPKGGGHEQLCSVWSDPSFDPKQRAFYYARVLENPTCRWSQHVCVAAKVRCSDPATIQPGYEGCCAPEHQPTIQERAWTSPIWYAPAR